MFPKIELPRLFLAEQLSSLFIQVYNNHHHDDPLNDIPFPSLQRRLFAAMSLLTQNSPRLPVLIIGAGIGGLTLAHSLAKHDIPYRLFERDAEPFSRTQGYRFTLNKSGASALKMATVPEVFEEFVGSCGESHSAIGRVDARTGLIQQGGVLGMLGSGGWGMIGALLYRYGWTLWQRGMSCAQLDSSSDSIR